MHLTERKRHESARDYALRILRDNIIRLELEPGCMVTENELADELKLSRGPVREALTELGKVRIIETYPQRGSQIALVDYALTEEACFMRETLECAVVKRCITQGIEDKNLAILNENVKLQQFFLENRNESRLLELDNEFHRLLFLNANVMQIYMLMDSMLIHFDRVRAMALTAVEELSFVEDHRLILDAIIQGDSEGATIIMHKHLTRYQVDREAIRKKYPQYLK